MNIASGIAAMKHDHYFQEQAQEHQILYIKLGEILILGDSNPSINSKGHPFDGLHFSAEELLK